jgi:hypothetical protein
MLLVNPARGFRAEESVRDEGVYQLLPPRSSNTPAPIPDPRPSHCGYCINRCCWDIGGGRAGNRTWRHSRDGRTVVVEILAHCDRVVDAGSDGTPSGTYPPGTPSAGAPSGGTPSGDTPQGGTAHSGTAASCTSGAEAPARSLGGGGLCVHYK